MPTRRTVLKTASAASALSLAGAALILPGCDQAGSGRLKINASQSEHYALTGDWIGQPVAVDIYTPEPERGRSVLVRARGLLEELEAVFALSNPASQVMELNRARVLAGPSDFLTTLNAFCREMGLVTGGAFNVGATPLALDLAKGEPRGPEFIAKALDAAKGHAFLGQDGVMNFSAPNTIIGFETCLSGFAADLLMAQIEGAGITSARINVGAQRIIGLSPEGTPFLLDTGAGEEPFIDGGVVQVTPLLKIGEAQNLDPREGLVPARYKRVSVIADSALTAECLARAFSLMPEDEIGKRVTLARNFSLTQRCEVAITLFEGETIRL